MKYLIRAVKYFLYVSIMATVMILVLVAAKVIKSDVNLIFRNGYDSLWQIALLFALVSLIYPKFGYTARGVRISGEFNEIKDKIIELMEQKSYILESTDGENMKFRLKSSFGRARRVWEDRISLTREFAGYMVEGPTKDVVGIVHFFENSFSAAADNME